MTDSDQSSAAASGPHRQDGDDKTSKTSFFSRLAAVFRNGSIREDLTEALEGLDGGIANFSASERAMLQNVLKLREMRVVDVMVPRADIDAVEASDTLASLILCFRSAGHSRLPVYEENLDRIRGFVHIKDALQRLTAINPEAKTEPRENGNGNGNSNGTHLPVKLLGPVLKQKIGTRDFVRKVLFVPPSMPVGDLLAQMQATRVHMAIVVDEYGGTDGLVTIEDLLEAVVGDIEDEHDEDDETLVRKIDDNTYIATARAELSELQEIIGPDFDPGAHAEEVDTLGGLLFDLVDRVPIRGEVISRLKGFEFEILSADARRIKRVRITRRKRPVRPRAKKPGGPGTTDSKPDEQPTVS